MRRRASARTAALCTLVVLRFLVCRGARQTAKSGKKRKGRNCSSPEPKSIANRSQKAHLRPSASFFAISLEASAASSSCSFSLQAPPNGWKCAPKLTALLCVHSRRRLLLRCDGGSSSAKRLKFKLFARPKPSRVASRAPPAVHEVMRPVSLITLWPPDAARCWPMLLATARRNCRPPGRSSGARNTSKVARARSAANARMKGALATSPTSQKLIGMLASGRVGEFWPRQSCINTAGQRRRAARTPPDAAPEVTRARPPGQLIRRLPAAAGQTGGGELP